MKNKTNEKKKQKKEKYKYHHVKEQPKSINDSIHRLDI